MARAEVLVGQAEINRLRTLIDYSSIRAPFDGVITARHVDRGAFVRSAADGTSQPLLRVSVLAVPEVDAPHVRVGTAVDINVTALGEHPFPGKVSRTAGALSPETRTMRAEVDVDNADGRLSPGMYARVVVKLEVKSQALVIPSKAVRVAAGGTIVLVVANGLAEAKPIEIWYDDGIWAEIQSGLEEQDAVITSAGGTVSPGSAVTPVFSES